MFKILSMVKIHSKSLEKLSKQNFLVNDIAFYAFNFSIFYNNIFMLQISDIRVSLTRTNKYQSILMHHQQILSSFFVNKLVFINLINFFILFYCLFLEEKVAAEKPGMTANIRERMGSGAQIISRLPNTLKDVMTSPRQDNNVNNQTSNGYVNAIIEVHIFLFFFF